MRTWTGRVHSEFVDKRSHIQRLCTCSSVKGLETTSPYTSIARSGLLDARSCRSLCPWSLSGVSMAPLLVVASSRRTLKVLRRQGRTTTRHTDTRELTTAASDAVPHQVAVAHEAWCRRRWSGVGSDARRDGDTVALSDSTVISTTSNEMTKQEAPRASSGLVWSLPSVFLS